MECDNGVMQVTFEKRQFQIMIHADDRKYIWKDDQETNELVNFRKEEHPENTLCSSTTVLFQTIRDFALKIEKDRLFVEIT